MKKLEFKIVVFKIPSEQDEVDKEMFENLGIKSPKEDLKEELMRYSFFPDKIIEYRESKVSYGGEDTKCIVCSYVGGEDIFETPPLLVSYEEFETQLEEYNK